MHDHATAEALTDHIYCQNCGKPLMLNAHFCSFCGQKPITGKITIHELLHQFLHIWLHIEGKLLATLRHLFIPGKLTQDFFKGMHVRYAHPVQLFFILGVLCFEMIECATRKQEEVAKQGLEYLQKRNQWALFKVKMDSVKMKTEEKYRSSSQAGQALEDMSKGVKNIRAYDNLFLDSNTDTLNSIIKKKSAKSIYNNLIDSTAPWRKELLKNKKKDTSSLLSDNNANSKLDLTNLDSDSLRRVIGNQKTDTIKMGIFKISPLQGAKLTDFEELNEEEFVEKYYKRFGKLFSRQIYKISKEGGTLWTFIMSKAFWGVVFIIPFISLLFLGMYRRKHIYFVEHLVFWMHYHAFLFFSLILIIFLKFFLHYWIFNVIANLLLFYIPVYLFMAMKRYYGDGYMKTFVKYLITGFVYQMLFVVAIVGVMTVSFLLF